VLSIVPRGQVAMGLQDHFGLAERPFGLGPDPRFLYHSPSYTGTLRDVLRALQRREGLVLVTGPAGTGKTMLCRTLLQQLDTPVCVSVLLDPCVTFEGLLRHMLDDFGIVFPASPPPSRPELMKALQRFLASLVSAGAYAVLVIDEAQDLAPEVLEQIRLLLNLETDRAKLLQIVLIGQPRLGELLAAPAMRQLAERIACRSMLAPLGRSEVVQYIEHRLAVAQELIPLSGAVLLQDDDGGAYRVASNVSFTPSALRRVAELSRGIPRSINQLCDGALDVGYDSRRHTIDARMVRTAARRLAIGPAPAPMPGVARRVAAAAALAFAAAGFGTWTWAGDRGAAPPPPSAPAVFTKAAPALGPFPAAVALLPLADGFHLKVASFDARSPAAALAVRLDAAGLPAFSRAEGRFHHVVVGPYLSEAEARDAEARLGGQGQSGATLFVERAGGAGVVHAAGAAAAGEVRVLRIVALPSGDRMSIAFALSAEPKKAALRVLSDRALELEMGPIGGSLAEEVIAPPRGTPIVREVALGQHVAANGEPLARARLTLHEPAAGNVRVVGRVVYVDLARPPSAFPTLADVSTPPRRRDADPHTSAEYRAVARRVLARLDEIGPFLQSAAADPSPDVLAAVAGTVAGVEAILRSAPVPAASSPVHDLLVAAVTTARRAVDRDFAGDRTREAAQALALFEAARREAAASGAS